MAHTNTLRSHTFFTSHARPGTRGLRLLPTALATRRLVLALSGLTLTSGLLTPVAHAQTTPADATATLGTVVVRPAAESEPASVTGFGDETPQRTPVSVRVIDADTLADNQVRRMSDVVQLDASASDAYNAIGYWDHITLRGFVLDNTYNHRRDGLPISAETSLGLENRERIELMKGTSGIQAGTSAPGGLVNHVIKRPTEQPTRQLRLGVNQHGNALAHIDLGGRFGTDRALGYRLNVASEHLRSHVNGTNGQRELAALAMDWRLQPGQLLEVELEHSRKSQPGVPGLSLTGNALPAPDPFININTQPWSQPGTMAGLTGSIRYTHAISTDWSWSAQASSQRLKADDFLAYPFGCYDGASGVYHGDRYCPNGDFDLYDYRSLNERRTTQALQWQIKGTLKAAGTTHHISAGVLKNRYTETGQPQVDNYPGVGTGNIYSLPTLPADTNYTDPYTNRTERTTEWFAHDRIEWNAQLSTWVGLRHSQLQRASVRTDGSRATDYAQSFTTPWLAVAWQWRPATMVYVSTGQGIESAVAPGRSRYTNAGLPLDPLKSRQWELGTKHAWHGGDMSAALFGITRPRAGDAGACGAPGSCTFQMDGDDQHRGLELTARQRLGAWTLDGSAMWLAAQRRNGQIDPSLNGKRPTNVPDFVLRAGATLAIAQVPGLTVHARASHEGRRAVVPDGSVQLPSWTRVDAGLAYRTRLSNQPTTWRLGVSNLLNRRYFQESPYQYSHIYLFPAAPRTVSLGLDMSF